MSRDVRSPLRPLRRGAGLAVLLAGLVATAPAHAAYDEAGYFRFADRIAAALPLQWSDHRGAYLSDDKGYASRTNANMLVLHAVAALRGHEGATRRDDRARRLVAAMTSRPMLLLPTAIPPSGRTICWGRELTSSVRDHVSLDSQIAEALMLAYRARRALGLAPATARRIVSVVDACARHPGWRYPRKLVNQFNWNAQLYAAAARVTGHHDLLRHDYRKFLVRFARGITRPEPGFMTPNLGPGYGFHYLPHRPVSKSLNYDTPEYANIVLSALRYYAGARAGGMAPLPARAKRLLRAWVTRILAGSWTHAGYLNWDTGHGRGRWHSGQYWAFAQQGLLAIASAPAFWARPDYGRWSKALFDHGLDLYARWAARAGGALAPQLPFDVRSEHRDRDLYAARIAANAMRAVVLGLGSRRSEDPPPLYAFDGETGRLAITTPSYSTAITPDNHGAFNYGGIDLARLYGPGQRVAANIGGRPPAAFGAIVRDGAGHALLASQNARVRDGHLRLTRSPRGPVTHGRPYPAHPYAGPFDVVEARGTIGAAGIRIGTDYTFGARHIDARWHIRCARGCAGRTVDVLLPTWGGDAAVRVLSHSGTSMPLRRGRTLQLRSAAAIRLGQGRLGGYVATPIGDPPAGVLRTLDPRRQVTDTHPGPTLAIRLVAHRRFRHADLALRLVPHGGSDTTKEVT